MIHLLSPDLFTYEGKPEITKHRAFSQDYFFLQTGMNLRIASPRESGAVAPGKLGKVPNQ